MRSRLDQVEARLQAFIESSLYLLPANQRPVRMIHQLVQALERTIVEQVDGNLTASNTFTISLHPQNAALWQANPGLLPALARVLEDAVRDAGLHLLTAPLIHMQPDPSMPVDSFRISTTTRSPALDDTGVLSVNTDSGDSHLDERPPSAFLIIAGKTIPLRATVINLGRRSDNQVVIDDPRVSRSHAQLRAIHGRYTLFDLRSTGGTFINNIRITQKILKPGDVISLAGFAMIYGEESTTPDPGLEDTHDQALP